MMLARGDELATIEDSLCGCSLRFQDRPIRDLAIPFDQRRDWSALSDHDLKQFPDSIRDRAVMAVDQQQFAFVVGLFGVTCKMNLAYAGQRKVGQILQRRVAMIGGGYEDIVDVEQ